ncbi:unnamed protein product [Linum trigynum]|uniref:F-box domain-containing protein n=1 Tax=Linum trigynum TaxID=586398 RepID=A0AAV2DB81_9ROSI
MEGRSNGETQGIDRLSNLPDHILSSILSFLNANDAVRSSILSNRWRVLWKTVPVLDFDGDLFKTEHKFSECVGKVLALRNHDCNLRSLGFNFGDHAWERQPNGELLFGFNFGDHVRDRANGEELFNQVMVYAASHGLQQLSVRCVLGTEVSNGTFDSLVGLVSYCNQSLETLEFLRFHLTSAAYSLWPRFKMLTTLNLAFCYLHDPGSENSVDPFAKFPCLKNLRLVCCSPRAKVGPVSLKISGLQLLKLEMVDLVFFHGIEVTAPKLESFGCWGDVLLQEVPRLNICSIDRAYIRVARYEQTALQPLAKQYMELFRALYNTKSLTIYFDAIKILSETRDLLESELSPFTRLMSLNVLYSEQPLKIPSRVMLYFMGGSSDVEVEERIKFHKVAPPAFPYS